MIKSIISFLVTAAIIFGGSYLFSGIYLPDFQSALIVAALLAFVNTFVRPILKFVSTPITFLSLGLFLVVINALMLLLVEWMMQTFEVGTFNIDPFWWAGVMAIYISIATMISQKVIGVGKKDD